MPLLGECEVGAPFFAFKSPLRLVESWLQEIHPVIRRSLAATR
jgi:hypothetical protein